MRWAKQFYRTCCNWETWQWPYTFNFYYTILYHATNNGVYKIHFYIDLNMLKLSLHLWVIIILIFPFCICMSVEWSMPIIGSYCVWKKNNFFLIWCHQPILVYLLPDHLGIKVQYKYAWICNIYLFRSGKSFLRWKFWDKMQGEIVKLIVLPH